jgi:hypothetical protein
MADFMKTKISIISILFTFLVSCADKEEAQKYAMLVQENSKMMSLCDYISNDQQRMVDSLHKIQENYAPDCSYSDSSLAIAGEIIDAIEVRDNVIKLKSKLDTQVLNYILLEKANEKFLYLTRHAVINKYSDELFFINKEIIDITGGLTTKTYLNKYLPHVMQLQ